MIFISKLLSSMLYSSIMTSSPMVKAIMVVATLPSISADFIATMSSSPVLGTILQLLNP